ncbi:MAG: hypothetical protein IT433_00320 [Phycisphaerales bacterium]|nr:hypothetical protein [Phycisphaerales bacterium]
MLASITNSCVWQTPPLATDRRIEPVCGPSDTGGCDRGVLPYWEYLEKQNRRSERVAPAAETFKPYKPPARSAMFASEWATIGLRLDVRA